MNLRQRHERAQLRDELDQLAGTPVPAGLATALYDLTRRGTDLQLVTTDRDLDQAAQLLRAADRHALLIIRTSDRRRLLRTRVHLQPLHQAVDLPPRLAKLATGPNGNAVRHKRTHGTGTASLITISDLTVIHVRADFRRHVARRTREGLQHRRNNNHTPPAPAGDQGARGAAARVSE